MFQGLSLLVLLVLILMIVATALRNLNDYERGVIYPLARLRTV